MGLNKKNSLLGQDPEISFKESNEYQYKYYCNYSNYSVSSQAYTIA